MPPTGLILSIDIMSSLLCSFIIYRVTKPFIGARSGEVLALIVFLVLTPLFVVGSLGIYSAVKSKETASPFGRQKTAFLECIDKNDVDFKYCQELFNQLQHLQK